MAKADTTDEQIGLVGHVKNTLLKPFDYILSQTAIRAYLTTFLFLLTSLLLLAAAVTAYVLFYYTYIPRIGFERTIHLQFDDVYRPDDSRFVANPYGSVSLVGDLVSAQRYDVSIELLLPRTRENRDAGNFMLDAILYAPGSVIDPLKDTLVPGQAEADNRIARSRRPAILAYRSPIVDQLYKMTELHWYLLGWRKEAESLTVGIFEGVEFDRGWRNVPSTMTLAVQSTTRLQIYSAKAVFKARFRGLRWMMYNHRIISAIVFTLAFWVTEMVFTGIAWAAVSYYLAPPQQTKAEEMHEVAVGVKKESDLEDGEPVLSDTERRFPTSSKQPPLRYESPRIKQEDEEDETVILPLPENVGKATEADDEDDEDEDADVFVDSGIGTSMESSAGRRDSVRRRRGRADSGGGVK
ncbi:putative adipose-regulatory protein-domain-containing protein [Neohortaea acidophila]|uniref:Putative adipose-regulatory protein-domain-containing protein n=1 Tax=Neohortaea acidophila TaxID=245834 RepID=A0A6A6Q882_9PEZI|nr:putative adipose-regulatory protein-domain-containing protein [Neohortaea acidophila]KAF2487587.1 putative adipose-regulatory protein-domain-containing protein [Neohortaea acidophila]